MGKGKQSDTTTAHNHTSTPITSLKDPASFAPPPKRADRDPDAVPHRAATVQSSASTTRSTDREAEEEQEAAAERREPAPGPFRVDTTGLSTQNLPKPPARHPDLESPTRPSRAKPPLKPKPTLPPRLPPRYATAVPDSPPPTYSKATEQASSSAPGPNSGALDRLGAAGISVPGLDIGRREPEWPRARSESDSPRGTPASDEVQSLQSRFSQLPSPSAPSAPPSSPIPTSTVKSAALRTASKLHGDPYSVSLVDARSAASTASELGERHGDRFEEALQRPQELNKKVGTEGRLAGSSDAGAARRDQDAAASPPAIPSKKAAPPPPPRRPGLALDRPGTPPSVPITTRPK